MEQSRLLLVLAAAARLGLSLVPSSSIMIVIIVWRCKARSGRQEHPGRGL